VAHESGDKLLLACVTQVHVEVLTVRRNPGNIKGSAAIDSSEGWSLLDVSEAESEHLMRKHGIAKTHDCCHGNRQDAQRGLGWCWAGNAHRDLRSHSDSHAGTHRTRCVCMCVCAWMKRQMDWGRRPGSSKAVDLHLLVPDYPKTAISMGDMMVNNRILR